MDKLEQDGEDGEGEDAEEDDVTKPDKTEDYEVTPPDTPEIPVPVGIEIPADLRSRSPNIANLIQKRRPSLATSNKSPVASFTPTPVDRLRNFSMLLSKVFYYIASNSLTFWEF